MRIFESLLLSRNSHLLRQLRKKFSPVPLLVSHSTPSSSFPHKRYLHDSLLNPNPNPHDPLLSRYLQPIPIDSVIAPTTAEAEEDAEINEFLSRFVWSIRGKLLETYPDLPRDTRDAMLLVICQKVVARLDSGGSGVDADAGSGDSPMDLSEDLWKTIWEVSASVHDAMRRDHVRAKLRKYLHCDEVKQMCRFAGEVGIRGDFLRELRFKWAREKMEEVDFYLELDRIRMQAKEKEDVEKGLIASSEKPKVMALPQRKGKIKYKIYGLDMSDPKWVEVSQRLEEAEKHIIPEEAQPVVGRSKRVEDKIMALDPKKDDLKSVFMEFAEALSAKRVDWLALLARIKEINEDLYFKAAEHLLDERTFDPNIRDYSKLIDGHSNAGRIEDAQRILNKMLDKGIQPDALMSVLLVHMYGRAGNIDGAKEAFRRLQQEGFRPDLRLYSSLITSYVKAGLPKEGEALIREMDGRGLKPTREMYMQVLRAFAGIGAVDGAQRIMHMMEFSGVQLDLELYKLLIEANAQAGDSDQARAHFDKIMRMGLKPDDQCTASMVAAYAKKNLLDKALEMVLKLETDGFRSGVATNAAFIDWMGRMLLVEEAELLLSKIQESGEPPSEVHVSLCDMYCRVGDKQKALQSLKILEGRKSLLQAKQFERIVNALLTGELPGDAKRMFDAMLERGFTPPESVNLRLMAAQSIPRQGPVRKKGTRGGW